MIHNKNLRRIFVAALLLLLAVLSFLVLQPIILSVVGGLILAYIFLPVYKRVFKLFRERNTSALAVGIFVLLIIFIPLWFLIPIIVQQMFDLFTVTQTLDISSYINALFPSSSTQFRQETSAIIYTFIGKITTGAINSLTGFLINLPNVLLQLAVVIFVFFFALRDHDKLKEFVSGLSPFRKEKEKILVKQFKDITASIIYGYIIVGIIQGVATGIGLFVFGVPQALVLTVIAIFASIIPIVGPWVVWIPASVFLVSNGDVGPAIGFALYSILFVSTIDNILRPYIVSKKTGTSSALVLIGMIGGLFVFGVLGLIIGPLVLAYLILFLKAYKENTLSDMFTPD